MNIRDDIETILTQYAQAIPDLFLEYTREMIQVVLNGDGWDGAVVFDIVLLLSEDEELLVGEMVLTDDFELSYEIFAD